MASRKETFPLYSLGSRTAHLDRLRREAFDVIVVGGGITGAGVAWDAATRGLRVALVEQGDFAGGTSSRSTKLLHGGLRYLQQADIGLVREALQERGVMQRLAPHLVELYPFLFPIYGGLAERAKLAAGLTLYDALALGSGAPRHSWLGADATRRLAPGLTMNGLDGAFVYRDAQTDDARMVVEVLRGAVAHGAVVVNRVAMREVTRHHGTVTGAMVEDTVTGETTSVDAPVVVAATGVWLERLVRPRTGQPRVRPAKGVHLFVPLDGFPADAAVYASTTRDRRLFFIVPWLGVAMLGTTDTPYDGDLASPETQASEVEYLLEATSRAFPSVALKSSDLLSTQAGLRPLVSTETGDDRATRTLSREDRVWEAEPGVVAIAGGKLTTFRHMAQRVVDLVATRLVGPKATGPAVTRERPLAGFARPMSGVEYASWREGALAGVEAGRARTIRSMLVTRYGAHFRAIESLIDGDPSMGEPLSPNDPAVQSCRAEALFAIRHEQAVSISDVLARRLRVSLLTHDQGRAAACDVASMFASEHGWTDGQRADALREYEADIAQFAVPGSPRTPIDKTPGWVAPVMGAGALTSAAVD